MINPEKIWSSASLPTLPSVAIQLLDLSRDPETEIRQVVDVIKTDPAITAKILKSTNSAFFGFKSEVKSIDRAVPLLGTTVVTSLALSFSLVEAAMTNGPMADHYQSYWMQSVVQGATAEVVAELGSKGLDCEFFLTGLLLDLGRLAMLKTIPNDYLPVLERAAAEPIDLLRLEREMLGVDHVTVGMKLMENWNLPKSLIHAVELHHADLTTIEALKAEPDYQLIKAVALTSAIGEYFCGATSSKGNALERLQAIATQLYEMSESQLDDLLYNTRLRVDEAGAAFNANTESLHDPSDLMAMANEQLAHLAMREHAANTEATARQQEMEAQKAELETKNKELTKQALHDPLTGAYNRNFFNEAISKEVDRCRREAATVGVLFSDIDKFKNLNDTYGHAFGDEVLKGVTAIFETAIRSSDTFARYGGEEFVFLLVQPTEKGLAKVAERIRLSVEAEQFFFEGKRVPVTISIGGTIAMPGRKQDDIQQQLLTQADEAMYEAKQSGRNQVRIRSLFSESEQRLIKLVSQRRFSRWLVTKGVLDIRAISKALLKCNTQNIPIGELAEQYGYLDRSQVETILSEQNSSSERFGELAIRIGLLTEETVAQVLAMQLEDPEALARQVVSSGLLDGAKTVSLLQEFRQEIAQLAHATATMQ